MDGLADNMKSPVYNSMYHFIILSKEYITYSTFFFKLTYKTDNLIEMVADNMKCLVDNPIFHRNSYG